MLGDLELQMAENVMRDPTVAKRSLVCIMVVDRNYTKVGQEYRKSTDTVKTRE